MRRVFLVIVMLVMASVSCLSSDQDEDKGTARIPTITPNPFLSTVSFPTPALSPTATQSSGATGGLPPANCNVPPGWRPYVVASGDTLSYIAFVIGSTVEELQAGNCLPNPDSIFIGQTLYLPSLPPGAIPIPTAAPTLTRPVVAIPTTPASNLTGRLPVFRQALLASPTLLRSDGASITLQQTIALDAGAVDDADRVRFYAGVTATDSNPVQIGIDTDPFDGTRIIYTFADFDRELYFTAIAENEFGRTGSNTLHVVYDPNFTSGSGRPQIQPFIGFDGAIYTLTPNATVTVTWTAAPTDAARVEFYLVGLDNSQVVIGTDVSPGDGARISWLVPANLSGQLYARAVYANGTVVESLRVNVYSES
jgi:LysM repeat protein